MKLGELRGAIRKSKGNPFVRVTLAPGIPELSLVLQKNPLYESLEMAFPEGKGQETGLTFNPENGLLSAEIDCAVTAIPTPVPPSLVEIDVNAFRKEPELDLLTDQSDDDILI